MDPKQKRDFAQLRPSELKTARVWALKETGMALYCIYEKPARKHFHWWYNWAVHSRLEPMKQCWHAETSVRKLGERDVTGLSREERDNEKQPIATA